MPTALQSVHSLNMNTGNSLRNRRQASLLLIVEWHENTNTSSAWNTDQGGDNHARVADKYLK